MNQSNPKSRPWWHQMFLFTKDGNIQNHDFLYGLFLGVGVLFVNFLIGNRLTIWFEEWFGSLSRSWLNALDTAVPSLLCAGIAVLLHFLIKKKHIVLMAYWIAWAIAAAFLIGMLFLYDRDTLDVLFWPFFCILAVPATACVAAVTPLYIQWRRRLPKENDADG